MATSGDAIVAGYAGGEATDSSCLQLAVLLIVVFMRISNGPIMAARDGNPETLEKKKLLKYSEINK